MSGVDEDRVLGRVLGQLDAPDAAPDLEPLSLEEVGLWREYSELAGLIPYAVDPVIPPPEIRARVLAAVEPRPEAAPGPLVFRQPTATTYGRRSLALLAAALGFVAIGLGIVSGSLYRRQQLQSARLEELSLEIARSRAEPSARAVSYEDVQRLRTLVTASGGRRCRLAPPRDDPAQPRARGTLIFDSERSEYFLAARDLEPCKEGQVYRLWFMVDGEPIAGQAFHVKAGTPVTLGAEGMPAEANGILVTLQRDDGSREPSGERVLWGDESEDML